MLELPSGSRRSRRLDGFMWNRQSRMPVVRADHSLPLYLRRLRLTLATPRQAAPIGRLLPVRGASARTADPHLPLTPRQASFRCETEPRSRACVRRLHRSWGLGQFWRSHQPTRAPAPLCPPNQDSTSLPWFIHDSDLTANVAVRVGSAPRIRCRHVAGRLECTPHAGMFPRKDSYAGT